MTADQMKADVQRAARSKGMQRLAACGFVAKGVVYAVIGIYALALATGHGGGFLSAEDAPREVQRQPFGDALLVALAIGLACHAVWRFAQAACESNDDKGALGRIGKRVGAVGGGMVASFLSITAFQHLLGRGGDRASWIQRVMRWDGGDLVIIGVGAGFIAAGLWQIYKAFTWKFRKDIETHEMSATEQRWLMRISRFGVAARGAVFPIVGWLFVKAGLDLRGNAEAGTGEALREIARQSWGTVLLGITAAGLIAYGLFMLVNARYRRAIA